MKVLEGLHNRLKPLPVSFSALNELPLGEYDCHMTVLDPAAQKTAFWRAPVNSCRNPCIR